ncbi:MAG: hypothetical protein RLZZ69_1503 [Cyanobacteriota bacterium]|jgi:hypothetical protein
MQISSWRKIIGSELYILDADSYIFELILLDPSLLAKLEKFARHRRAAIGLVAASESVYQYEHDLVNKRLVNTSDSWLTALKKDKEAYENLKRKASKSDAFQSAFLSCACSSAMYVFKDERLLRWLPFFVKRFIWRAWGFQESRKAICALKVAIADWFDFHGINYFGDHGSCIVSSRNLIFDSLFLNEHGSELDAWFVTDAPTPPTGVRTIGYREFFARIGALSSKGVISAD